ncbi:hypothetical protein PR048_003740 [Dryococelus australis]|uniref:Uncharacterized protein n=1 Tax=Dryococelus australis TaxID=614101 RepID=A0ABQ9IP01_9NEOP|nr:hypothetical protein PR048_003740 [Dryococelus australis]
MCRAADGMYPGSYRSSTALEAGDRTAQPTRRCQSSLWKQKKVGYPCDRATEAFITTKLQHVRHLVTPEAENTAIFPFPLSSALCIMGAFIHTATGDAKETQLYAVHGKHEPGRGVFPPPASFRGRPQDGYGRSPLISLQDDTASGIKFQAGTVHTAAVLYSGAIKETEKLGNYVVTMCRTEHTTHTDNLVMRISQQRLCRRLLPSFCEYSHRGEPGSIPGRVTGFSNMGIVSDDAVGPRVFSGISRFPSPFHSCAAPYLPPSPSSALKSSLLRAAQNVFTHSFCEYATKIYRMFHIKLLKDPRRLAWPLHRNATSRTCRRGVDHVVAVSGGEATPKPEVPRRHNGRRRFICKVAVARYSRPLALALVGPRWLSGYPARLPPRRSGLNPWPGHSGFSHVGTVPDDAVSRRVFSGISRFIPALLHTHFNQW